MIHQKLNPYFAILFLTLIASGAAYWLVWQSTTMEVEDSLPVVVQYQISRIDTSDWKTYRNEKYGFEVKYPKDWFIRTQSGTSADQVILSNVQESSELSDESLQNESGFVVDLLADTNPKNLGLESWYAEYFRRGFSNEPLSKITTTVDGRSAIRLETVEIVTRFHFYILNGKDAIDITYSSKQLKFNDIYQKMLSTFKFIK